MAGTQMVRQASSRSKNIIFHGRISIMAFYTVFSGKKKIPKGQRYIASEQWNLAGSLPTGLMKMEQHFRMGEV